MTYPLAEYQPYQWWAGELRGLWCAAVGAPVTADQKRAAKVALNLLDAVVRDRAMKPHVRLIRGLWCVYRYRGAGLPVIIGRDPARVREIARQKYPRWRWR